MGMSASSYNARANQITKEYYHLLRSFSYSRNNVYKVLQPNGKYAYFLRV